MAQRKDPADRSPEKYVATNTPHVFHNTETDKYVFSDETQCFDDVEYDSEQQAAQAMHDYVTFSMDGPAKLKEIENMLDTIPGLDVYTCVHMAKKAFSECRGRDAIAHLRVDADKLRMYSEKLYDLVMNKPKQAA